MAVSFAVGPGPMGCGNLLGVQPWMVAADYASQSAFRDKLAGYRPDRLGLWMAGPGLSLCGRNISAHGSPWRGRLPRLPVHGTLTGAMRAVAIRHFSGLLRAFFASPERDRLAGAIFRTGARAMALHYQAVFSGLARGNEYDGRGLDRVLPSPKVADGKRYGRGWPSLRYPPSSGQTGAPIRIWCARRFPSAASYLS